MFRLSIVRGLTLLALLLASLFVFSVPHGTLWQGTLLDAAHGPVFAGIAFVLVAMRPVAAASGRRRLVDYAGVLALCVALGLLTEWAQRFLPGRSVSLHDVLSDTAGALLGLAVFALLERPPGTARRWAWTTVFGALLVLAWQPLQVARAYAERGAAFPTLAPTGRAADEAFVAARGAMLDLRPLPAEFATAAGEPPALRLTFAPGAKPALELTEPAPDWRGWSTLALDVTNPGDEPTQWILRILDQRHDWTHEDRLNLPVTIPPRTRTTLRVAIAAVERAPAQRLMDLGAIGNVMLFATRPSLAGTEFYVSRVWLE